MPQQPPQQQHPIIMNTNINNNNHIITTSIIASIKSIHQTPWMWNVKFKTQGRWNCVEFSSSDVRAICLHLSSERQAEAERWQWNDHGTLGNGTWNSHDNKWHKQFHCSTYRKIALNKFENIKKETRETFFS